MALKSAHCFFIVCQLIHLIGDGVVDGLDLLFLDFLELGDLILALVLVHVHDLPDFLEMLAHFVLDYLFVALLNSVEVHLG